MFYSSLTTRGVASEGFLAAAMGNGCIHFGATVAGGDAARDTASVDVHGEAPVSVSDAPSLDYPNAPVTDVLPALDERECVSNGSVGGCVDASLRARAALASSGSAPVISPTVTSWRATAARSFCAATAPTAAAGSDGGASYPRGSIGRPNHFTIQGNVAQPGVDARLEQWSRMPGRVA